MTYKVLSFDENIGSLLVQFSDNVGPMNIDVPLKEDGTFMAGEELDTYIRSFIPTSFIARLDALKNGVPNIEEVKALVAASEVKTPEEIAEDLAKQQALQDLIFERKLADVLVKFGVLESNPVVIPVQEL
jgi:hypothetical protein